MSEKSNVFPHIDNKGNCIGLRDGNKPYDLLGEGRVMRMFEAIQKFTLKEGFTADV